MTLPLSGGHHLPIEVEPLQIFSQAVGVVGAGASGTRRGEQTPAGIRQRAAGTADADHLAQLHVVERIDFRERLGGEQIREIVFGG